jgi:toxin ParE1/3/4
MSLRLLGLAEEDLSEITSYIAADNPSAAADLLLRFEKSLDNLKSYPFMGRVPDDYVMSSMGYRYLVVDDYLIFYTMEKNIILIHRFLHGARKFEGL